MDILWNLTEEDKKVEVRLVYNVYLGIKKLYIDSKEILCVKSFRRNKDIDFEYNEKVYKLQILNDGYNYKGYLVTPEGEKLPSEVKTKEKTKTPLWIIPFILINISMPILATETLTFWIIGIGASYGATKVSQKSKLQLWKRIMICILISIATWLLYAILFKAISGVLASNDGFFPHRK